MVASMIIFLASCGKRNEQPQAGPKAFPKEEVTHCGPYLSGDENSYDSGNTSVGLLTKQDSLEIEQLTGRKIIGEIDTALFAPFEREYFTYDIKREKDFVIKILIRALDYNISDSFSIIHFFYDNKLSCPKDCPDIYVWLSDPEAVRLQKHISRIADGDSLITIKGDSILRRIRHMDSTLSVTLGEEYHNGREGSTTIIKLGFRSLSIHSHHHHFCQTHMTPGLYERMWITQNERKKRKETYE